MKNFVVPLLLLAGGVLHGQTESFEVRNEMRKSSLGEAPAFVVDISGATLDEAKSVFQNKMKAYTKEKPILIGDEYQYLGVVVPSISASPLNIYVTLYEKAGAVSFVGFFYIDSAFVDDKSFERTFSTVHKFVDDYAKEVYQLGLSNKLSGESSTLAQLKKNQKNNPNEQEKNNNSLVKANRQIEKSEMKIKELKNEVELLNSEIYTKKESVISYTNDPEEKKKIKAEISNLEKRRWSINKQIDKEYQNINSAKANIRELELELTDLKKSEAILLRQIAEHENEVEGVKSKMKGVK